MTINIVNDLKDKSIKLELYHSVWLPRTFPQINAQGSRTGVLRLREWPIVHNGL